MSRVLKRRWSFPLTRIKYLADIIGEESGEDSEEDTGRWDRRYQHLIPLDKGGFSRVYRATDSAATSAAHEEVAIKMEPVNARNPQILDEGGILAKLQGGPGIPFLYGYGSQSIQNVLVMELLGPNLHTLLRVLRKRTLHGENPNDHDGENPFDTKSWCLVGLQVNRILANLHKNGYIHRDIKPSNFCVTQPPPKGGWNDPDSNALEDVRTRARAKKLNPKTGAVMDSNAGFALQRMQSNPISNRHGVPIPAENHVLAGGLAAVKQLELSNIGYSTFSIATEANNTSNLRTNNSDEDLVLKDGASNTTLGQQRRGSIPTDNCRNTLGWRVGKRGWTNRYGKALVIVDFGLACKLPNRLRFRSSPMQSPVESKSASRNPSRMPSSKTKEPQHFKPEEIFNPATRSKGKRNIPNPNAEKIVNNRSGENGAEEVAPIKKKTDFSLDSLRTAPAFGGGGFAPTRGGKARGEIPEEIRRKIESDNAKNIAAQRSRSISNQHARISAHSSRSASADSLRSGQSGRKVRRKRSSGAASSNMSSSRGSTRNNSKATTNNSPDKHLHESQRVFPTEKHQVISASMRNDATIKTQSAATSASSRTRVPKDNKDQPLSEDDLSFPPGDNSYPSGHHSISSSSSASGAENFSSSSATSHGGGASTNHITKNKPGSSSSSASSSTGHKPIIGVGSMSAQNNSTASSSARRHMRKDASLDSVTFAITEVRLDENQFNRLQRRGIISSKTVWSEFVKLCQDEGATLSKTCSKENIHSFHMSHHSNNVHPTQLPPMAVNTNPELSSRSHSWGSRDEKLALFDRGQEIFQEPIFNSDSDEDTRVRGPNSFDGIPEPLDLLPRATTAEHNSSKTISSPMRRHVSNPDIGDLKKGNEYGTSAFGAGAGRAWFREITTEDKIHKEPVTSTQQLVEAARNNQTRTQMPLPPRRRRSFGQEFIGTVEFGSPQAHVDPVHLTQIDDMISFGYMMISLRDHGRLPWSVKNPTMHMEEILEQKASMSHEDICKNCPKGFSDFFDYFLNDPPDHPADIDYDKIEQLFLRIADEAFVNLRTVEYYWDRKSAKPPTNFFSSKNEYPLELTQLERERMFR